MPSFASSQRKATTVCLLQHRLVTVLTVIMITLRALLLHEPGGASPSANVSWLMSESRSSTRLLINSLGCTSRPSAQKQWHAAGRPITRAFFDAEIAGRHNPDIAAALFPHWSLQQQTAMSDEKEALFRHLAAGRARPLPSCLCHGCATGSSPCANAPCTTCASVQSCRRYQASSTFWRCLHRGASE